MSVLGNLEAFETALAVVTTAFVDQLADNARTIQLLRRDGRRLQRERDQARREAAAWRDAYRGATGTSDDTSLSWEADTIEAGTLLGSVAGR